MKKLFRAALLIFCVAVLLVTEAGAIVPYKTYTYDIDGNSVDSPHAYVPDTQINSAKMGLTTPLSNPSDMTVDADENLYIADPSNNRIVILNKDYSYNSSITNFINSQGVPDDFSSPNGIFIKDDDIYICDTENNRIVVFKRQTNEDGKVTAVIFDHIVIKPESTAFPEGSVYKPISCAVDTAGRIYVVSSTTNYGVISMNAGGEFLGFLGAQKTAPSAWQVFWRMFQTKEQRESLSSLVPTEYNNITIDESGFIYVTTNSLDDAKVQSAIASRATSGDFAPVKKLNAQGTDVMMRTGFWPPSGEVTVATASTVTDREAIVGVSQITDVTLGSSGMWTIVDSLRQRFYSYDAQGNLLFIFGDKGAQVGNNSAISSICYQGSAFLALDRTANPSITVYKRTEYGDALVSAIQNVEDRNYDQSAIYWQEILQKNANFDEAYVGIGDSYYRAGNYEEAQKYYAAAYDATNYSRCYSRLRKSWIEDYIILIPIVIVAICVALSFFFRWANKVNKAGQVMKDKRTFKEAVLYGFHVIFHPFDGFWDLKHEKRGNFKAGIFYVILTIVAFAYYDLGRSFWFDPYNNGVSIIGEITGVLLPLALWVVANWCLTTLFEGEGSFKDICLSACYALLPMPMLLIPATILTNILALEEGAIITLLVGVAYVWTGFLLFFGVMVTHDYTFGKNILTVLGTLVAMVFIMFIIVLFAGLFTKIWSFIFNLYTELSLRV